MKKILIVAAAAGLMSLAACKTETNNTTVDTNVETNAENLTDVSENTTNEEAPTNASNAL